MAKKLERIVPREEDFAAWYTSIVSNAKLCMYSNIKGMMYYLPNAWSIWESIRRVIDEMFATVGVKNLALPTLIPLADFKKEKDHIEGFMPELFTINQIGQRKLDLPYCLRPTSEILFCDYFKNIVSSYNDLPVINNQWCSVFRAEKTTKPFLRNSEFHWQELHAIFNQQNEALKYTITILDIYQKFFEDYLLIPVIKGVKTPWERFAGAVETYTLEALMQDGQALQSATSHYLGTFFSKAYDIKFQTRENTFDYVHQMSAGLSTRIIGALIMVHADDKGLVLPPKIAPVQIAILTIFPNKNSDLIDAAKKIGMLLNSYRVSYDHSDKGIGYKLSEQEINGTPISIVIGKNEILNNKVLLVRRDTGLKKEVTIDQLEKEIELTFLSISQNIYEKAKKHQTASIVHVNSLDEMKEAIQNKKMAACFFDGTELDDKRIKEYTNASSRCIFDTSKTGKCIVTGKETNKYTLFARAY
ncbi:proline--tRNA ligase [Ureaplasma canigenitalium]|uniref:proline--tRNA ligase n=1 Tax=Ureaplasma canigenitalium TaxID=42092 RepID=UPI0004E174D4|nr:proline--tRNA ligase [Ureaplasma canigenitalium]